MYRLKYYLCLMGITVCFGIDVYSMSADKPEIYTPFKYSLINTISLNNNNTDTDGDGVSDTNELANGTAPNDPCSPPGSYVDVDCDGDGLTNNEELTTTDDPGTLAIPGTTITNPSDRCNPAVGNNTNTAAIDLTNELGNCYYGFNLCATDESSDPNSCGYNKASVWYTFSTDIQGGDYEIRTTNTDFNNVLTLFDAGLSELVCVNDDEFSFGEHIYRNLPANTTYYIMVSGAEDGIGTTEGVFCIEINEVNIPTNQECDVPNLPEIDLVANSEVCVTGSNRYASNANPQPSCNPHPGASVWYEVSAFASDMIKIETFPNFSEVITVYGGTCGNLKEIACSVNGEDNDGTLFINGLATNPPSYIQVTGNFPTIEADNGQQCNDNYIIISTISCPANMSCDDNNPNTTDDKWKVDGNGNCICAGDCANKAGDICDDGDDTTPYDFWDDNCNCQDQCLRPVTDCPNSNYEVSIETQCKCKCTEVGKPCNDSDPNYVWNALCECVENTSGGTDYCPTDIILNIDNIDNNTYFQASDYIETDGSVIVDIGEDLTLNAGNYIKLKPGFSVKAESTMRAYIDGCEAVVPKEQQPALASVKHYPNPFKNEVTLEFQLDYDADAEIIMSDVNGRKIAQVQVDNLNRGIQAYSISTQNWIPGIYFYQAIVKEHNTGMLKRANGTLVKM